jgi:hypothetical protein
MDKKKEQRFSVRFPLDVLEDVKQFAQEDKRSINSEIVWIFQEYIKIRRKTAQKRGGMNV